jgi:deoxyribodipyrimidine photolyase
LQLRVVSQTQETQEHDQNLVKGLRKENLRLQDLIDKANTQKEEMKKQITEYLQGFNQYEDAIQQKENQISNHVDQIGS